MRRPILCAVLLLAGCPSSTPPPAATGETESPKDSPVAYKVLKDETSNNSVEYHILVAETTKHDDVEGLLKYLYRHTMTRKEDQPAGVACYVYFNEAAYQTPPRTPVAQVVKKGSDPGPTFENKVPLEFWQEVEQALRPRPDMPRLDEKFALKLKVERDDANRTLTVTQPYTEAGMDKWADTLSFNQAMQAFTDIGQALFEKVPDLKAMTFVGNWKDKEIVRITLTRSDYSALKLNEIDERIGQHHGTAFLKLATGKGTDASVSKETAAASAKEYRAMLAQLKGKATVSPTLK
jgi:hypothetical protein